jgi:hypothetical protein
MFRTFIKIIGMVLVAAAVAAPVASAGSHSNLPSNKQVFSLGTELAKYQQKSEPTTPRVGEGYSLGVPLEYQQRTQPTTPRVGEGFSFKAPSYWSTDWSTGAPITPSVGVNRSLGVPAKYLGTGTQTEPRTPRVGEGFSLGVPLEYQQQRVEAAGSSTFDWSAAAIGAGIVAGAFLLLAGIGGMTIKARQERGRVSAA